VHAVCATERSDAEQPVVHLSSTNDMPLWVGEMPGHETSHARPVESVIVCPPIQAQRLSKRLGKSAAFVCKNDAKCTA